MSDGVVGVETNESSRFIDHTLATPWEELIVSLENSIKALIEGEMLHNYSIGSRGDSITSAYGGSSSSSPLNHIDIQYSGQHYRLERRVVGEKKVVDVTKSSPLKKVYKSDSTWLRSTYGMKSFLVLSQGSPTGEYSASVQTSIRSAFIIAVKHLKALPVPQGSARTCPTGN